VTLSPPVDPTVKAPAAKQPAEAREASQKYRTPEPLIDPKTGRATSVPVAPLDDARPGGVAKPITIVPPAPLD